MKFLRKSKTTLAGALILTSTVIVALLAACGTGNGTNATPTGSSSTSNPTSTTVSLAHSPTGTADLNWDATSHKLTIKVALTGLAPSSTHPEHIHTGSCQSAGAVVYGLKPVVADATGASTVTTTLDTIKDGIPASGWYINIHNGPELSPATQHRAIACGNIATSTPGTSNQSVHVALGNTTEVNEAAKGTAQLSLSSSKLTVKLTLSGLEPNSTHMAHIHKGSCTAQGGVVYALQPVVADAQGNSTTTTVISNVSSIPTSGWYVNVHQGGDMAALGTQTGFNPIACGNVA